MMDEMDINAAACCTQQEMLSQSLVAQKHYDTNLHDTHIKKKEEDYPDYVQVCQHCGHVLLSHSRRVCLAHVCIPLRAHEHTGGSV